MKKLNVGVLLIQFLGMIFLINGIFQLRLYTVADKVLCIKDQFQFQKSENWDSLFPTNDDVTNFWPSVYIWIFFALLIGIFYVTFLNWKSKLSSINTILLAIALYILLRLKFFRKEIFSHFFRPIRVLLSDDFGTQCLIEGVIFTLIGFSIIYFSVNSKLFNFKKEEIEN
ncbi:Prolipoprotein diacylglyceryl transferase [Flavobacterium chungbukense]|uniref:Exosortase n=1 Tax=Flavobacterium chungbukense TaxID=877464 RepID=A0ABP7YQK7_9FLAO